MSPERFAKLRELLLTLPGLDEEKQRSYLDEACADDPELRREAESLLAWKGEGELPEVARTAGALRWAGSAVAADAKPGTLAIPERIGPYRILGLLGHGGMGVVYRAEQTEPIRREVAIKLMHRGLDQDAVLSRFEMERQTLALMEHPGIASVFDAGEDENGHPYFVMELVRGVPITDFCRAQDLSLGEKLQLFRDVCHAVQHAHQKGIIHRDLKPTNLLVTTLEGKPVTKVIDFGIAKVTEGGQALENLTRDGQLVGTLEYMSPEQASGNPDLVDMRSDVYSLGVVLYEVLTGALPYETRGKSIVEAARIITEDSPAPTRSKGISLGEDVESIILKALEKEPARRYVSAAALAEDIERYTNGHPILARPPSAVYQIRKLVTRNKVPFALAGALFVLAVAFGLTMAVLFQAQRKESARAESEAQKAQLVNEFLRNMLASVESRGNQVTVRDVLDAAANDVETTFADRPEVRAALHSTIGNAYTALQEFNEAKEHLDASLGIRRSRFGDRHPDVAESYLELAAYHQRLGVDRENLARADSLAVIALELYRELLGADHPDFAGAMATLAAIRHERQLDSQADSLYRESIRITRAALGNDDPRVADLLRKRANALHRLGKTEEAKAAIQGALETLRRHFPGDHTSIAACINDLAYLERNLAVKESLKIECLAMQRRLWGRAHPNTAEAVNGLGVFYGYLWRFDEALPLLREALSIVESNHDENHESVARASNNLAAMLDRAGAYDEAETLYRRSLSVWQQTLGPLHKNVFLARSNLARVLDKQGKDDESWSLFQEGLKLAEKNGLTEKWSGLYFERMAAYLNRRGRYEEAETLAGEALAEFSGSPGRWNWTSALEEYAEALLGLGRPEAAEAQCLRADSLYHVDGELAALGIANRVRLGRCMCSQGRLKEAQEVLLDARERFIATVGDDHPEYLDVLIALAELRVGQQRWDRATELLESISARVQATPRRDTRRRRARELLETTRAALNPSLREMNASRESR